MGLGCSCNFQSVRRTGFLLLEVMIKSQKCLILLFHDVLEQCKVTDYGYGFSRNTMSSVVLAALFTKIIVISLRLLGFVLQKPSAVTHPAHILLCQ